MLVYVCSYTKPKGQLPDYETPVVLPRNKTTVEHFCLKIHKQLLADFSVYVCISPPSIDSRCLTIAY
jgi:ribosome-interacting GTPase 1